MTLEVNEPQPQSQQKPPATRTPPPPPPPPTPTYPPYPPSPPLPPQRQTPKDTTSPQTRPTRRNQCPQSSADIDLLSAWTCEYLYRIRMNGGIKRPRWRQSQLTAPGTAAVGFGRRSPNSRASSCKSALWLGSSRQRSVPVLCQAGLGGGGGGGGRGRVGVDS